MKNNDCGPTQVIKDQEKDEKIKFPMHSYRAWSCLPLHWPCAPQLLAVRTKVEQHARPCVPPVPASGCFALRHGRVPHKHDCAHLSVTFGIYKLLKFSH